MTVFKCKMCGGEIEYAPGASIGVCAHCGTRQTLPRLDDDRRANLYDRANHFRRNNEFDKAAGLYEQILNEDRTDAEAYWSLVLCRYGIEYVEDPKTRRRVPTVNRTQFTSVFDDEDYRAALQYADTEQRRIYEAEAAVINEIQKGILAISQKEEPFDVFICYKEADNSGRRTPDSVLANDLYHHLTQEGFKVFFSRITLEDKLGVAYEPYIFAALNSAKVMVVLGTKAENFNAAWVKNEWSRYLSLVERSGGKKVLIPAYRDMDPYDLPEEFSHLMAQDMSKLGFMQDLIRGIQKIVRADESTVASAITPVESASSIEPLLKRAFMFLEDGDFASADAYCERVLDQEPENAQAYLGKLLAELRVRRQEDLPNYAEPFDSSGNYQKAVRFGDEELSSALKGYIDYIKERNENARQTNLYEHAVNAMNSSNTEATYKSAAEIFKSIAGFRDADALYKQCLDRAEASRKDAIYRSARLRMSGEKADNYEAAIKTFRLISEWRDSDEQIRACQRIIDEIRIKEEADHLEWERQEEQKRIAKKKAARKLKRTIAIVAPIIVVCIAFVVLLTTVIIPKQKLNKAMGLLDSGDYEAAYALLEEIGNNDAIASSKYDRAISLIDNGDYEAAYILLDGLDYKDSADRLDSIKPEYQKILLARAEVGSYVFFGSYEQDNDTTNGKEDIEWLVLAKEDNKILVISKYALDCQPYNTSFTSVTWETCSLRKWLNGTFINNAFSSGEQSKIQTTTVTADKNPSYSTSPSNNTTDKVFLLSVTEVNQYFSSDSARQCQGTAYCYAQGAHKESNGNCWWWLRSPGDCSSYAAGVNSGGSVRRGGDDVDYDYDAVRPALWIEIGE